MDSINNKVLNAQRSGSYIIFCKGKIYHTAFAVYHIALRYIIKKCVSGEAAMPDNKLVELSFEFAKKIVSLSDSINVPKSSYMINQIARAGTSIGANIHEAQYAHSRADFIAKLEIALKEANETSYWLRLLAETGRISETDYKETEKLCGNIRRILISSITTAKENQNNA